MLRARIAVVGDMAMEEGLTQVLDSVFEQVVRHLTGGAEDIGVTLLTSEAYTGELWGEWGAAHGFTQVRLDRHVDGCDMSPLMGKGYFREGLCDLSDCVIGVWSENVAERAGDTWEALQCAYARKTPCIWVSSKTHAAYCLWDSYYESFGQGYLDKFLEPLPKGPLRASPVEGDDSILQRHWVRKLDSYLRSHKAEMQVFEPVEDVLLKDDVTPLLGYEGEQVRRKYLEKFREFDNSAIAFSSRVKARLYQRSVLPFIATIFLAIGFYAETLIGETFAPTFPSMPNIASILAGIGFLVHGCLNLYVWRLSKSEAVAAQHRAFVRDRYTAEVLRVALHVLPFGTIVDLRRLCRDHGELYPHITHLADDVLGGITLNTSPKRSRSVVQSLADMLGDQLAYHRRSCMRYQSVTSSLSRWAKVASLLAFAMVIGRGLLQFVLVLFPLGTFNGFDATSVSRSALNMLALMLPAWAGYFSSREALNGFRFNYENHKSMAGRMEQLHTRAKHILELGEVPVEVCESFAEEVAETLLFEDVTLWASRYESSTIRPL